MGATVLPAIARQLVAHGLPSSTPVALIDNGTSVSECRVVGTLAAIERQALRARLQDRRLHVGDAVGFAVAKAREFRFESRVGL